MDFLLRLLAIGATAVLLLTTALMLVTFRRARRVTTASLLVPVLMSVAILFLYCVLLRARPSAGWLATDLVAGVVLGALWARTHRLFRARDGGIRSRANLWYLAVWASVLALNQVVVLAAGRTSPTLAGLLVFSTGIAVGNGLTLLLRARVLRLAALLTVGVAAMGAGAGADDVLLLLPRDFDVQPIGGWGRRGSSVQRLTAKDLAGHPDPFRFRGEDVTQEMSRVDHHPTPECLVDIQYHHEYRAKFRRGTLTGRWLTHQRNFYRGCKGRADGEYMRMNHEGRVTGQADASGRLELTVDVIHSECLDASEGGWVKRADDFDPWSFGLEFQLPVGELQSNQEPTRGPTPAPLPAPRADAARRRDGEVAAPRPVGAGSGYEVTGRSATAADERGSARPDDGAAGTPGDPAEGGDAPVGGSQPVSPLAAAGTAAAAAALGLLGAGWMLASSGVRPGDLLSAPPAEDFEPLAPAPQPRDGDLRLGSDEVWSAPDGGWVSRDLYELDRGARHAEVERAQAISDAESRDQSAQVDRELRASEARQGEASARQAEAARVFALEASFQPQEVEPYQPGWSARVTQGLEWAEYGADSGVSLLGEVTGEPGKLIGTAYTIAKETVKGTSEGVAAYAREQAGHVAEEGSAWVIAERASIGLAKGVAKVGLDQAAGKVMEGASRLASKVLPELADIGTTPVVGVLGELASGAGEGAIRRTVGIAAGKTLGSQNLQKPVNWGVEAATGEKP